ncbi:MAG: peptidase prepilin type [Sphingomonadales bacterium]|nr:peptidase prepilin type [Sphingomonadales bacterium]
MAIGAAIEATLDAALHLRPKSMIAVVCLLALAALMIGAVLSDLRRRRIPNRLCLAIAILALPYWLATDPTFLRLAIQILCAAVVAMTLMIPFYYRVLGGGDVKMMAALALWLPPDRLYETILMVAMGGGLLAIGIILFNRRSMSPTVPYGVAIAAAGLFQVVARLKRLIP